MSEKNWPFSNKSRFLIVAAIFSVLTFPRGFGSELGKSGGKTLERMSDAKTIGLAESVGALDGDVHGIFVNPATLGTIEAPELAANALRGFAEDNLAGFTYAHPTDAGTIAAWINHYDAGQLDLQFSDGTNHSIDGQQDTVFGLGYAFDWSKRGALGFDVKFFRSELAEEVKGQAVLFDIGLFQKNLFPNIHAGLFGRNIGSKIKYDVGDDPPPTTVGVALGFDKPLSESLGLKVGVSGTSNTNEQSSGFQTGAELLIKRLLALRLGIKKDAVSTTTLESLTLGVGFQLGQFQLDYAIVPSSEIPEQSHAITVLYKFKKS